jgi:hypothetical protein
MAAFHGSGLHRVEHLQTWNDFACSECPDLKLAVGDLPYPLRDQFGAAEKRVEALRPAGRHAPSDGGL